MNAEQEALLPCPFCGGDPVFGAIDDPDHEDHGAHFIQCTDPGCGASSNLRWGDKCDPKPLLAEQWNRRHDEETKLEPELEEALCSCGAGHGSIEGHLNWCAWLVAETALAEARREEREECAKVAERIFGGKAHTYASENADIYRTQDETCARIANAIRARGDQ